MTNRHFYKCTDCLSVIAIDDYHRDIECACGGRYRHMGKVKGDRIVNERVQSVCDSRCTGARGPKCNCQCGGKNHGTHAVVTVTIEAGKIPIVSPPDAQAQAIADEFRAYRDYTLKAIENYFGYTEESGYPWLDGDTWVLKCNAFHCYRKGQEGKIHKNRIKNFTQALAFIGGTFTYKPNDIPGQTFIQGLNTTPPPLQLSLITEECTQ